MKDNQMNNSFSEIQKFSQTWLVYFLIAIAMITIIAAIKVGFDSETNGTEALLTGLISFVVILFVFTLLYWTKLEVLIEKDRILYRFFPIQIKFKNVLFDEIKSYIVRKYSPIFEYGGWGIRYGFSKGWAYNVSGNIGIQIETISGKKLLFGSRKPDEFFKVLDSMIKKNKDK
jgi:low affinity Fe/Cu permease